MLNELVGCERSLVFFEAFATEESVMMQLGLQKMHNVRVRLTSLTFKVGETHHQQAQRTVSGTDTPEKMSI